MRLLVCFVISMAVFAQQAVDPRNLYERLLCVVPIVGAGTFEDPKRPLYAPVRRGAPADAPDGIIAYSWVPSDDGRFALVEFVARDRSAFEAIVQENRSDVKRFERGKARREEIEAEFRKHKKDFNFNAFGARVQ
ncbi:MAG: hypothetical protein ACK5AZ_12570 [Bryobacteraceae bacterium]